MKLLFSLNAHYSNMKVAMVPFESKSQGNKLESGNKVESKSDLFSFLMFLQQLEHLLQEFRSLQDTLAEV